MLCNTKIGIPLFALASNAHRKDFAFAGGGGSARSGVKNKILVGELGPRPDGVKGGVSVVTRAEKETGERLCANVALAPGERNDFLACAFDDGEVVVYDTKTMEATFTCRGGSGPVCLAIRENAMYLVTSMGSTLMVFPVVINESGAGANGPQRLEPAVLVGHLAPVVDLHAAIRGNYVLSTGEDDTVRLWDLGANRVVNLIPSDVAAGLTMRKARFDSRALTELATLPPREEGRTSIITLQVPKNRRGASYIMVWSPLVVSRGEKSDAMSNGKLGEEEAEAEWVVTGSCRVAEVLATTMAVHFHIICVATAECNVVVVDRETLTVTHTFRKMHGLPVTGMLIHRGHVVTASADGTIAMVRLEDSYSPPRSILGTLGAILRLIFRLALLALLILLLVLTFHCEVPLSLLLDGRVATFKDLGTKCGDSVLNSARAVAARTARDYL